MPLLMILNRPLGSELDRKGTEGDESLTSSRCLLELGMTRMTLDVLVQFRKFCSTAPRFTIKEAVPLSHIAAA